MGSKVKENHIIWLYSMLKVDGQIIFSFDSLVPGDQGYGPPGGEDCIYQEPPAELLAVFSDHQPRVTGQYEDEYGSYYSAFSPILDPESGEVLAVIGADIESDIYNSQIRKSLTYPIASISFALISLFLIFAYFNRLRKSKLHVLEALEKAQQEKTKMEILFSVAGEPIVVCDSNWMVTFANRAALETLKISSDQIKGKSAFEVFSVRSRGKEPRQVIDAVFKVVNEKHKQVSLSSLDTGINLYSILSNHEFPVLATISPVMVNERNEGNIIVFSDISHLVETNRLKSEFISLASHQLRTPISKMKWLTEMLIDDHSIELSDNQKQLLNELCQTNQQTVDLVNSLLNISKLDSGHLPLNPEETDLIELARKAYHTQANLIEQKHIQYQEELEAGLPKVMIDQKILIEVYKNLLNNAIKYSPDGGRILLKIYQEGSELVSQVSDCGLGIPEYAKSKIFERFYRADNAQRTETDGSGLGLYFVKSIVESSGGRIWFETKENEGTTFWFTIPISPQNEEFPAS